MFGMNTWKMVKQQPEQPAAKSSEQIIFFNYIKLTLLKVKSWTESISQWKVLQHHYFSPKGIYCTFLKAISLDWKVMKKLSCVSLFLVSIKNNYSWTIFDACNLHKCC